MDNLEIIIEVIKKDSNGNTIGTKRIKVIGDDSSEIESSQGEPINGKDVVKALDDINGYVLDSISFND